MLGASLLWTAGDAPASYQGSLDPTFGQGGIFTSRMIAGEPNWTTSLARQSDGKLLVGGAATSQPDAPRPPLAGWVVRLTPAGAADRSFGQGGQVALPDVGGVQRVVVAPDGHVLVLGSAVARLNADGSRDSTFGGGGTASLPGVSPKWFTLAADGKIILVGTINQGGRTSGAVGRLTPDGQPDRTFGNSGRVVLPQENDSQGRPFATVSAEGAVVDPDGRVVVAGIAYPTQGFPSGVLARVMPDGALDSSFGQGGQAVYSISGFSPATLTLTPDGRIEVAASGNCDSHAGAVAIVVPFSATGQPAPSGLDPSTYHALAFCGAAGPRASGLVDQWAMLAPVPEGGELLGNTSILWWVDPRRPFGLFDTGGAFGFGEAVPALPQSVDEPASVATPDPGLLLPDGKIIVGGSEAGRGALVARVLGLSAPPPREFVSLPRQRIRYREGRVSAVVGCSSAASCHGKISLLALSAPNAGSVTLGAARFAVVAGRTTRLAFALSRAARTRLAHKPSTRAVLVLTPDVGFQMTRNVLFGSAHNLPRASHRTMIHPLLSTFDARPVPNGQPIYVGSMTDPNLGNGSVTDTITVLQYGSPTGRHSTETFTLHTAHGTVSGTTAITESGDGYGTVTITGAGTITSGTGTYQHARGTFVIAGTEPGVGPKQETFSGFLRY